MKKSLLLGLLGLAATVLPTFGQSTIILDNYNTSNSPNYFANLVTYGNGFVPTNGVVGAGLGITGHEVTAGSWTVGFYYALGTVTIGADPNSIPWGDPSTFTGGLQLATGAGSTAGINNAFTPDQPGAFLTDNAFSVPGTSAAAGQVLTMELVVYSGSTYDTSFFRGHDNAFQITTTASTALQAAQVGEVMTPLAVYGDPEPSVFALSSLSAALILIRRRKQVVA